MKVEDFITTIVDAIKNINIKEGEQIEGIEVNPPSNPEPKKETTEQTTGPVETEVDARDIRIKELTDLLAQKDAIIVQNTEQITALKELTSVNNPAQGSDNLSLEEIIMKGEF